MPLALQSKLLRVLQEQEVEALGSNRVQRVDVRVIAATSRDLQAMVAAGTFRADLYYRINVLPIRLPALRERLGDLEALVDALAEDIARRSGLPHKGLNADALALLERHDWPGNIRELRNVLEQATLMTDDLVLAPVHFKGTALGSKVASLPIRPPDEHSAAALPMPIAPAAAVPPRSDAEAGRGPQGTPQPHAPPAALKPLPQAVAELEAQSIHDALAATAGNKLAASRLLGISRATLYEKLVLYPRKPAPHPSA
jgi:DNA-binding NtrC family response regulator